MGKGTCTTDFERMPATCNLISSWPLQACLLKLSRCRGLQVELPFQSTGLPKRPCLEVSSQRSKPFLWSVIVNEKMTRMRLRSIVTPFDKTESIKLVLLEDHPC